MSSTFSFSRLGKLIKKQFFENTRLYAFSVLALFGLLAIVFAFWIMASNPGYAEEATWVIFLFGLFITGSVFASMSFSSLGSKDKGIYWLSIPATHLEKLVCTIFYSTIVFTAVYCLCFFIVKSIAVMYINGLINSDPTVFYHEMTDYSKGFGEAIPIFIYAYFAVQAFYLLGSVYFTRFTFIMTTVVGAVLIFSFAYYMASIQSSMFKGYSWEGVSVNQFKPDMEDGFLSYSISPAAVTTIKYIVQFVWAPLFWVVTWFRLKEKEI